MSHGQPTPSIEQQTETLVELGLCELTGQTASWLREQAAALPTDDGGILAVHPKLLSAAALASRLQRAHKSGFVVEDMTDLEQFTPRLEVTLPDAPLYVLSKPDRGLDLRNWTPDEALPEILARNRTPLTIHEGISWLLQQPDLLAPNECFMCIASRKPQGKSLDARTPAIWISGGTGHDDRHRKGSPKIGWCWAGNRHTWLGMGSAAVRLA